jgi:hypothetical protein
MKHLRISTFPLIVVAALAVGTLSAQAQAPASGSSGEPSSWTRKHWNEVKATLEKEKDKWTDCRKQSKEQKLRGKKSWAFLYACMKK